MIELLLAAYALALYLASVGLIWPAIAIWFAFVLIWVRFCSAFRNRKDAE